MRLRRSSPVGRVVWGNVLRSRSSKTMVELALAAHLISSAHCIELKQSMVQNQLLTRYFLAEIDQGLLGLQIGIVLVYA